MSLAGSSVAGASLCGTTGAVTITPPTPTATGGILRRRPWLFPDAWTKDHQDGTMRARTLRVSFESQKVELSAGAQMEASAVQFDSDVSPFTFAADGTFEPRYNPPGFIGGRPVKFRGIKNPSTRELIAMIQKIHEGK